MLGLSVPGILIAIRRSFWGGYLPLLAEISILVVVFSLLPNTVLSQNGGGPAQSALAGSQVFGAKRCPHCHSINGIGDTIGPDLAQYPRLRSFYELAAEMWNHIPDMAQKMRELEVPTPHLDAREAGDLVAFLFTVHYFDAPGDTEVGRQLFSERQCIVCHQVNGIGGVIGPNLDRLRQFGSPIEVAAAMWNHGPSMSATMREHGVTRSTFTGDELRSLIAYLESASQGAPGGQLYVLPGRADRGRRWFADRLCIRCHSIGGRGGVLGPDLAEQGRLRSLIDFAAAMWNKAPAMTAAARDAGIELPQLDASQMADIVAYLYAEQYFHESGVPSRGRRRLRDKGCLDCHTLDGRGGTSASDLGRVTNLNSPAAVIAAMWNHLMVAEAAATGRAVAWASFRPEEMADVASFFIDASHR